jgi:Ca2+-binding EF-hand superfamily protein
MKKLIIFFISLCFSCSAYANFQYAVDEYYKENYKAAFSEFQILAEQGDAIAQVYLALMYRSGNGVIENEALANAWDTKSLSGLKILASQGDPEAQFWFAETMSGDEAEIWYKKSLEGFLVAAKQGDSYSQGWVSWNYSIDGYGADENQELSKSWELKSAAGGDALQQYWSGQRIIDYGELTKYDEEAIIWITRAAKQGHLGAIADLKKIGIDVELVGDSEFEELLSVKNTIQPGTGLAKNRIGKWFIGSSCNNITSEVIVLHDQIMKRPLSSDLSINMLMETNNNYSSKYQPLSNNGELFFFEDNIIFSANNSSGIHDYYFESLKFPELSANHAYKSTQLLSCKNLNNDLGYIALESDAIEFDKFLYSTKNKCENTKPIDCLRQFLDFADASNNNKLSRAELTRFSRFIVKWLSLKGELQLNESIGTAASTMFIGPALAELILRNYDYDNDGHIDIREITYDIVNITGSSELNQKIIRGYIEAIDIISKSKKDAVRILEDIF